MESCYSKYAVTCSWVIRCRRPWYMFRKTPQWHLLAPSSDRNYHTRCPLARISSHSDVELQPLRSSLSTQHACQTVIEAHIKVKGTPNI